MWPGALVEATYALATTFSKEVWIWLLLPHFPAGTFALHTSSPLWHAGVCRCPDLISVSLSKFSFAWWLLLFSSYFRASQNSASHLGHYLLPYPVPPKLVLEGDSTRFDDLFSHAGLKTHAAEWAVLVSWVWEFGISYYCLLQQLFKVTPTLTLLLTWNSHSLPLLTLQNPQKQANSGLGAGLIV